MDGNKVSAAWYDPVNTLSVRATGLEARAPSAVGFDVAQSGRKSMIIFIDGKRESSFRRLSFMRYLRKAFVRACPSGSSV